MKKLFTAIRQGERETICALLDARRILPQFHPGERRYLENRVLTPELDADLMRIFRLIVTAAPEMTRSTTLVRPEETLLMQYLTRNGIPCRTQGEADE